MGYEILIFIQIKGEFQSKSSGHRHSPSYTFMKLTCILHFVTIFLCLFIFIVLFGR